MTFRTDDRVTLEKEIKNIEKLIDDIYYLPFLFITT